MPDILKFERRGRICVATFENPPVNAISHAVREAFLSALHDLWNDADLDAMIIRCAGKTFFSGADIREFGSPAQSPLLPEVISALDTSSKAVVAAIHGQALGGGLEVAMACQGRVATPDARLGLPEVNLGLLPGAGGTQYLPRIVGIDHALEMIALGKPLGAQTGLEYGLLDAVSDGDLMATAVACAMNLAQTGWQATSTRTTPKDAQPSIDAFRQKHARRLGKQDAPAAIYDVLLRTASLPLSEGLAAERAAFERLRDGPQSKALRHVFHAERAAARLPELKDILPRPVETIAVIGGGTMGSGIAAAALLAGYAVIMVEQDADGLARGSANVGAVVKGRGSSEALGRFSATLDWVSLAQADLIIEAAFEDLAVKKAIFQRLGEVAGPNSVLASNTSYLDIDAIAAASGRPGDVLGLHFFSPAHIMRLLEVVRGDQTAPDCLATALAVARRMNKTPVVARNAFGFIGNRMLAVRKREAEALLLRCGSPQMVDKALEDFGFPMGPFKVSDLAGLDLGWTIESSDRRILRDRLCEAGRKGRKTGGGYYNYDESGKPLPSSEAEQIIAKYARERGVEQQDISPSVMRERLLLPMIEEGRAILEEGIARSPSDIDVVWINGYGWPRWTGGPMYWADSIL